MKRWTIAFILGAVALGQNLGFPPVTDQMLENPDPADWLMWRRTLNGWGYIPLKEIDRANVGKQRLVWTRGMGAGIP